MNEKNPATAHASSAAETAAARYVLKPKGHLRCETAATLAIAAERHQLTFIDTSGDGAEDAVEVASVDVLLSDDRIAEIAENMSEPPLVVPRIDVRLHRGDGKVDCYDTDVCFHQRRRGVERLPTTTGAVGTRIEDIAHRMVQAESGLIRPTAAQHRAALMQLRSHPAVGESAQGWLLTEAVKQTIAPMVGERWSGVVIEWNRNGATTMYYRRDP